MGRLRCNNRILKLGIVAALLLALFLTPLLPGTASAAEYVENMYALVVTTGNMPGENVCYFGLQYQDTDGYNHVEYVFPHKEGLKETLERAAKAGSFDARQALLRELGMSGNASFDKVKALQRGQTDTYFFEPEYEVAKIQGILAYCQGTQGEIYSWDVSGMRLYSVEQLLGVQMNGYYSNDFTVRFNGTLIGQMEERGSNSGVTLSWTGNRTYRISEDPKAHQMLKVMSEPYTMESKDEYVVRLDIADSFNSGLESANQPYDQKNDLTGAGFNESMVLQIEYLNVHGDPCLVKTPVVTSTVGWMVEHGVPTSAQIAGIAQQGDTIAFGCYLPQMQSITSVTLFTGSEAKGLVPVEIGSSEEASVTGVSIYDASLVSVNLPNTENSADGPKYNFGADPLYYHTASTVQGEQVSANGNHYMTMRPYESGARLLPVDNTERYLVEILSKETQVTGIPEDITVQLQYVDMAGATKSSQEISVRSSAKDYYGYWPSSGEDFAYTSRINSDDGIRFLVELQNVEHFTGLRVSIAEGPGAADWQMSGFRVVRLDAMGQRYCVWEDVVAGQGRSNRVYNRDADGYLIFSMSEEVLIQPGSSYEMDFVSNSVQQADELDWSDMQTSMTYDQCTTNLGLAKTRENYVVEVQVQRGTTTLDSYGDNGSKNRFYFLLEFENGVSGYVLANQQLGADGFRSGCTESFIVSTNYNYGDLVAVHVIPDDISEDSDPYDKLNIDQIRVRRANQDSVTREWVVENVGWIGIDYRDEGAGASISGQQGRTESDMARTYPVSYSTYALNLEFMISTGVYSATGSGGSFYGTMEATLEYFNQDGQRKQITFDVIRAMYDYANKSPIYQSDGTTGSGGEPLAVSDTRFMFRENHTDRFVYSVSDVVKLDRMTLNMKSLNGGSLQINDIAVSIVTESGRLQLNDQDEYVRSGSTEYLCGDNVDKIPAYTFELPTGRNIYQEVYFSEHDEIKLDTENNTWVSAVTREPQSKNDTLNIFVYPAEDAKGSYEIDVRAVYTDVNGRVSETAAKSLNRSRTADGKVVYSVNGLKASGMSALNKLYIKAQSVDVVDAYIDHVIVQQVRSGVVINTFYLDCEHRNADMEFYAVPSSHVSTGQDEQKVYLSLGGRTDATNLVPEIRDVAVAIRYTNVNDTSDQEYTSRFVYITDQDYNAIKDGDLIELTFNEPYVDEIKSVLVATTGNVKAQVDMACVDSFRAGENAGELELVSHASFATGASAENNTVQLKPKKDETVQLMEVEFITAEADTHLESGTDTPIAMVVCYTDGEGVERQKLIHNVRDYVVSSGEPFSTGSSTRIRLLLRNAEEVRWLQLMPYDRNEKNTAGWKLGQVALELGYNGSLQKANRKVDVYIQEGKQLDWDETVTTEMVDGHRVNLANVVVKADVRSTNAAGLYGTSYRASSMDADGVTISAVSGGKVVMYNVEASNSEMGVSFKVERMNNQLVAEDVSAYAYYNTEDEILFDVPENTHKEGAVGTDDVYRITLYSQEVPDMKAVITVIVPSVEEPNPTEPPTTDPTDPTVPPVTDPTDPTVPPVTDPTDPTVPPVTDPPETDPTDPTEPPTTEPTVPPTTEATEPPTTESTEPPTTESTEPPATESGES